MKGAKRGADRRAGDRRQDGVERNFGTVERERRCAGDRGGQQGAARRRLRRRDPGSVGATRVERKYQLPCVPGVSAAFKQDIVKRAGADSAAREPKRAGCGAGRVQYLRHQDPVADGQRTPAAGVADCHVRCAARADRCAVYDQRIGARCGAALVEHRVELQRAAIGDEGAGAEQSRPGARR